MSPRPGKIPTRYLVKGYCEVMPLARRDAILRGEDATGLPNEQGDSIIWRSAGMVGGVDL